MSRFIQSLESRTLLSVTPVAQSTLLADQSAITADVKAAKADLKALTTTMNSDTKAIRTELKGLPKSNAPLLRTLRLDESKYLATTRKDLNALTGRPMGLARRSTHEGIALAKKSNARLQTKLVADVAALQTSTTAPLAKLQADDAGTAINADLQALVAANPTDATLATAASTQQTDLAANAAALNNAAMLYQSDMLKLSSDLATVAAGATI